MKIGFRHGIVRHQVAGGVADFLKWNGNDVSIHTINDPLFINISHKDQDYLHHELNNQPNAWIGPFDSSTIYWLWLDLDPLTGVRTFFHTTSGFVVDVVPPVDPVLGDHWYDLTTTVMKQFNGLRWIEKIRIVIGTIQLGNQIRSYYGNDQYTGTQVGINTPVNSGSILLDNNDRPIFRHNQTFLTTETLTSTTIATTSQVKLSSIGFYGIAAQPISSHTAVELRDDGRLYPTNKFGLQNLLCGLIEQDVTTGEVVRVSREGTFSKDGWNWSAPSVGIYVDDSSGELTESNTIGSPKIGYAIDATTIHINLSSGVSVDVITGQKGDPGEQGQKGESGNVESVTLDSDVPTPTTIGGIPAGTTFDEVPVSDVLMMLLYPYQLPAFTAFTISGLTNVEVGVSFPEMARSVNWSLTNTQNVQPNIIGIYNVTDGFSMASGLPVTGPAIVNFPVITSTSSTTKTWRISALNTQGDTLTRNFSISWNWAIYYGESSNNNITGFEVTSLRVKNISASPNSTASFIGGGYKYYTYPVSMGLRTNFKDASNNLDVAMEPAYTVNVINEHGIPALYYVHRTTNVLGGSIQVIVS